MGSSNPAYPYAIILFHKSGQVARTMGPSCNVPFPGKPQILYWVLQKCNRVWRLGTLGVPTQECWVGTVLWGVFCLVTANVALLSWLWENLKCDFECCTCLSKLGIVCCASYGIETVGADRQRDTLSFCIIFPLNVHLAEPRSWELWFTMKNIMLSL